ncbi:GNAT family N-acetyltransferase [Jeotgalibacillus soli]|uniref:GNAT family acetyltransferase n=1 Tax=Jeotgalibacillus soli TaxID=889306 RepID=A0A0C2RPC6_9BACL|nr:GNAT family N-acetyltransferase [Jeotgalibacillus soli]KIL52105.1 GNAT family acetyltransferase [Jeotgalibacillus soli]
MEWKLKQFEDLTTYELYQILKERNAIFVVEQQCAYQEIDGYDLKSSHLILEDEGMLVAYARLLPAGVKYDIPSVGRVIVNPAYRGKGIARDLISNAVDIMVKEWQVTEIKLQAQTYLRSFYRSFGFEETSEEYLDDGIPHVDMLMKVMSES